MAATPAEDGSFRTVPMGFDKNEVNAYIDKYRKRLQEADAFKRTCEERISAAEKAANAAKKEVEEAKKQLMASATEYEVRLKTERRNNDLLTNQIDDLKRKLKNGGSGKGAAGADKQSAEIISAANAQAQEIINRANKTAQDIIASAQGSSGNSGGAASASFIAAARKFIETISQEFNIMAGQAGTAPISTPDFSNLQAPQASAANPTPREVYSGMSPEPEVQPINSMSENLFDMDSESAIGGEVEEIQPIDESESASFDADFTATLLAQSSAVTEPEPVGDFGANNAADNPWASLQAEFNSLDSTGASEDNTSTDNTDSAMSNPWSSLQAEFNSLSGGFESDSGFDSFESNTNEPESYNDDPQVPDTNDSSLWNFGGNSSDDDDGGGDDMSSDLFGGF